MPAKPATKRKRSSRKAKPGTKGLEALDSRLDRVGEERTAGSSFLNVDLNIRSRDSLEPLMNEWRKMARIPDSRPPHKAHWILVNLPWQPKTAESAIRGLLRLVNRLSKPGRRAWNRASSRIFDIGIQAGIAPRPFEEVRLSRSTLRELARLDGSILVTVYAPHREVAQE